MVDIVPTSKGDFDVNAYLNANARTAQAFDALGLQQQQQPQPQQVASADAAPPIAQAPLPAATSSDVSQGDVLTALAKDTDDTPQDLDVKIADSKNAYLQTGIDRQNYPIDSRTPSGMRGAPSTPQSELRNTLNAFANPLMWLGIAGSLMTRRPAINAMTAAGAMMESMRSGKNDLAKLHGQKMRSSMKSLNDQLKREEQAYGEILSDPNMNNEEKLAAIRAQAAGFEDAHVMNYAQKGDLKSIYDIVEGRHQKMAKDLDKAGTKAEEALARQELKKRELDLRERGIALKEKAAAPATEEGAPSLPPGFTQQDVDDAAQRWLKTGDYGAYAARTAKNAPYRAAIEHRGNELAREQGIEPKDIPRMRQLFKAEGQKIGIAETAEAKGLASSLKSLVESDNALGAFERKSIGDMQQLIQLAQKVDRTGVPAIERWIRAGKQSTGDPDVAAFHTQWTVAIPEISRIVTQPRLVGQLTDTARHEIQEALPFASSVKQLQKSLAVLQGDFQRRDDSYKAQIAKTKYQLTPDQFPKPTDKDREVVRRYPEQATNFVIQFGVEP